MTETPIDELKKMRGVEVDKEGNPSDIKKEMVMYKKQSPSLKKKRSLSGKSMSQFSKPRGSLDTELG